jgi:hypothetical protein
MRPAALLFVAVMMTTPVVAQDGAASRATEPTKPSSTAPAEPQGTQTPAADLPVSIDRIRKALERPPLFPLELRNMPTFRIEVQERNRLQDILSTLDFSSGPTPAGGTYASEIQRVMFPSVSNPLRQPYAAFNQPELLTIILENLAGRYLAKKAIGAITSADRAAAQEAARAEVPRAITLYCAGQPNDGAGIKICTDPPQ